MSRKVAFVNDMILKTLNQHQQTVSPDVKKAANLDDDISEVLKRRDVNVYDKAKLYSQVLQQYLYAKETIHPTQAPPPVVIDTKSSPSLYSDDSIIDTVPKQYKTRAANMLRFCTRMIKLDGKKMVVSITKVSRYLGAISQI